MSDSVSQNAPRPLERRSRPVIVYLAFLMLVFVIPAFAFSGVLIHRNNVAQEEVVETFTVATTRSVVQAVEREIAGMITTLRVLMTSETLVSDSLARFHTRAQTALAGTGAHLVIIDPELNQLLNTRVPFGTPLGPMSDPQSAQRAFETSDAVVSSVFFGQTAQEWVFNVMLRREIEGADDQVIILTQNARNLSNSLLSRELPEGWHVALVDGNNTVIAASQNSAVLGEPLFIPLVEGPGTALRWREREVAGDHYRTITQRSILTGWYVVAWAPDSTVDGPLRTTLWMLVLGGLAIVGLAGLAAALVARQIARSVRGLAREARKLGTGEPITPTQYPVRELALVSNALAEAADKRKAAETEVQFLMRELAHRSKNQLTVISAMAKQTAQGAGSVDQFVDNFQNRIFGLGRSTDLLLAHGASGIGLRDLFKTQIDPFRPEKPDRIKKTGPDIRLNVQAAQVLGMAAHELATNASKYGAFSTEDGRLEIDWHREDERLRLSWRERVPGFVAPDERKGFGTVVVKTMVASTLKADVERIVHDDGIEWTFSIPLSEIDPDRDLKSSGAEDELD